MAPRKTTRPKKPNKTEKTILAQFLAELDSKMGAKESRRALTKGQALARNMVNQALSGDEKMLANVLKLIDKLDHLKQETPPEDKERRSRADWELLFAFYGKYKTLIEQEIARLKADNPSYWNFDWFHPTLKSAPWYKDVHG